MNLRAILAARFDTSPLLSGKLRDTAFDENGEVVRGNYLLLFTAATPDRLTTEREARSQTAADDAEWSWTLRAVAVDVDGVHLMLGAAFALLVGWKPEIPGRSPTPIAHLGSEPIQADRGLTQPLLFGETDYSMRA